jgi:hypothetical protein
MLILMVYDWWPIESENPQAMRENGIEKTRRKASNIRKGGKTTNKKSHLYFHSSWMIFEAGSFAECVEEYKSGPALEEHQPAS